MDRVAVLAGRAVKEVAKIPARARLMAPAEVKVLDEVVEVIASNGADHVSDVGNMVWVYVRICDKALKWRKAWNDL